MAKKRVIITQIRSSIGRDQKQIGTLAALGLGRIGRKVEHEATPSVIGMAKKVSHLIDVREVD